MKTYFILITSLLIAAFNSNAELQIKEEKNTPLLSNEHLLLGVKQGERGIEIRYRGWGEWH